ncbi:MAG: hypothetical protein QF475_01385, partial [Candidatus Undinarchaeales archaeon]|nr:hypothetical protein [Candidatus Undinarchaeales archaeon]
MDSKFAVLGGVFLIAVVLVGGAVFYFSEGGGFVGKFYYGNNVEISTCGPTTISQESTSVVVSKDLQCSNTPILIGASNVLVDCQGHTLTGAKQNNGIQIGLSPKYSDVKGVTIKNCKLEKWSRGIMVYETTSSEKGGKLVNPTEDIHIRNVESNNNELEGISFWRVDGGSITKTKASGNKGGGLKLYQSINLRIGENIEDENDFTGNIKYGVECAYPNNFQKQMNVGGNNNKVDSVSYYCRGPVWPVVCSNNNDCNGATPYCDTGRCVVCKDDPHCDGVCENNKCVECREPADCDDGKICDFNYCTNPAVCGNGIFEKGEGCDDKNKNNGDGCSSSCQVEPGWSCTGRGYEGPTKCTSSCGDGKLDETEACDDGNKENADGCSDSCQIEVNYECSNPDGNATKSVCEKIAEKQELHIDEKAGNLKAYTMSYNERIDKSTHSGVGSDKGFTIKEGELVAIDISDMVKAEDKDKIMSIRYIDNWRGGSAGDTGSDPYVTQELYPSDFYEMNDLNLPSYNYQEFP